MVINQPQSSGNLFVLQASKEEFEKIQALFESGALSELLGTPVLDVGIVPKNHTSQDKQASINLSQWLKGIFEGGWEASEILFSRDVANPAFGVRSPENLKGSDANHLANEISRGKLIDLGIQVANIQVALLITLMPTESDEEIDIRLQLYPVSGRIYLPQGLQLTVLDESSTVIPELKAEARSTDNYIQLEFGGKLGEQFSVEVALGNASITEDFLI